MVISCHTENTKGNLLLHKILKLRSYHTGNINGYLLLHEISKVRSYYIRNIKDNQLSEKFVNLRILSYPPFLS